MHEVSKKFSFLLFFLFAYPSLLHAQIIINEIMYDLSGSDTGREWVEIYNADTNPVTISTGSGNSSWRFSDNSGAHTLTLLSGSATIASGGYAIFATDPTSAGFLSDWPNFSGTIFKSSFSLPNTSATLSIKDGSGSTTDQVSYTSSQGANGDGNSLQKQSNGSWIIAPPTPGTINSATAYVAPIPASTSTDSNTNQNTNNTNQTSNNDSTNQSVDLSVHYSSVPISNTISKPTYTVGAGRPRIATVGTPIEFKGESNADYSGQTNYKWSFGDGAVAYGHVVSHTYLYVGDYAVILNATSPAGQAVSRANVIITPGDFVILEASPEKIEIQNNSDYEINLFGRELQSEGKSFDFPQDTIIKPNQKISFANTITGLYPFNKNDVSLVVVGDNIDKNLSPTAQLAENKSDTNKAQISILYSKALEIQKQLATVTDDSDYSNTASALAGLDSNTSATGTPLQETKHGWFDKVKLFFFGK